MDIPNFVADAFLVAPPAADMEYAGRKTHPFVITVEAGEDVITKFLSFNHSPGDHLGGRRMDVINASGIVRDLSFYSPLNSEIIQHHAGNHLIASLTGSYQVGVFVMPVADAMCATLQNLDGNELVFVTPRTMVVVDQVSVVLVASPMDFHLH